MQFDEYRRMAETESTSFWHVGRREILFGLLSRFLSRQEGNRILDIGCGTGGDMLLLKPFGNVVGLDNSPEALRFSETKGFSELVLGGAERLPFASDSFNLVGAFDVLEHIAEDGQAIHDVFRVLKPGGVFLVTVPAFQWLWSRHDVALHHYRRYRKREIVRKLNTRGFHILYSSHFVFLGMCVNGLRKLADTLFKTGSQESRAYGMSYPRLINSFLLSVLRIERFCMMYFFPIPLGSSIVVVAQKPL